MKTSRSYDQVQVLSHSIPILRYAKSQGTATRAPPQPAPWELAEPSITLEENVIDGEMLNKWWSYEFKCWYHNVGITNRSFMNFMNLFHHNGIWLVPLWKILEFISWDDDIPHWMESHKIPWFQTTNQGLFHGILA